MFNQLCSRFVGDILLKPKFQSTFENKSWAFLPGDLTYSLCLCSPPPPYFLGNAGNKELKANIIRVLAGYCVNVLCLV